MKPEISQHYDLDPRHWYFVRDSKIPHGSFDIPLRERLAEWAALGLAAVILAAVIVLANYYLF